MRCSEPVTDTQARQPPYLRDRMVHVAQHGLANPGQATLKPPSVVSTGFDVCAPGMAPLQLAQPRLVVAWALSAANAAEWSQPSTGVTAAESAK
jgi:hypothetical protein